mmetsp:Transcript_86178/g.278462  ORF Transcript_86178/g.278462 Transcript_86178/m.278462 type:complete len:507 (-) Transcript_86178:144-1664(-)
MAHLLAFQTLLQHGEDAADNASMVDDLQRSGALHSAACIAAFRAVDRGHFWVSGPAGGAAAYADMPVRHGKLHQSAPHIYARALEGLMPLQPGMSFLNIGSGTGYFSSLVAELLGNSSINDGIDIWPETIAHAKKKSAQLGRHSMEFTLGNVYELDINLCMRYDRIYIGACASPRAEYLYELLEIDGILVAPFQTGYSQQLRKVVRQSEKRFKVEVLNSVHFASLLEPSASQPLPPPPTPQQAADGEGTVSRVVRVEASPALGLPGVPFTFALRQRPWSLDRSWAYPAAFRRVVEAVLASRRRDHAQLCLPPEIWQSHILPWCPRWWFEREPPLSVAARALTAFARTSGTVRRALLKSRTARSLSAAEALDGSGSEANSSTTVPSEHSLSASSSPELGSESAQAGGQEDGEGHGLLATPRWRDQTTQHQSSGVDNDNEEPHGPNSEQVCAVRRLLRCIGSCCQAITLECMHCALRRSTAWRWAGARHPNTGVGTLVPTESPILNYL